MITTTSPAHLLRYLRFAVLAGALGLAACSGSEEEPTTPSGCTPGSATGCPAGQICGAAAACVPAGTVAGALVIDAPDARACEILLESTRAKVVRATFATGVHGALRERSPRTAIAVSSSADQPFAADAIVVELDGEASSFAVKSVDCYDRTGAALSGASAALR